MATYLQKADDSLGKGAEGEFHLVEDCIKVSVENVVLISRLANNLEYFWSLHGSHERGSAY
jgi:hypothetical protein